MGKPIKIIKPIPFLLVLALTFGCKASKNIGQLNDYKLLLEAQVQRLIKCLNEKNSDCLTQLYADDFKSISPIMEISSKESLIARTIKGFAENNYTAEATVEEITTGENLAYVVMEYRLYEPGADNGFSLLLQKKRIDIWQFAPSIGWQLKRSAFYDPQLF